MRVLLILLLGVLQLVLPKAAGAGQAASPDPVPASPQIMQDVKAGDWSDAFSLAQATDDPLMVKLVTFFQLLRPGGGTAGEIKAFMRANPDWPEQHLLALRAAEAAGVTPASAPPPPDPFLTRVQALEDKGDDTGAAALWVTQGKAAAAEAAPAARLQYWPAQNELARDLLAAGDAKDAYAVVNAVAPPAAGTAAHDQSAERDFFAGFLLLRFLNQPARAAHWFSTLAASSTAVITQARAYYWRARCESGEQARGDYAIAASYPDTYYGQLAAMALGNSPEELADRILNAPEPAFTLSDAVNFAAMELPRAAVLLTQMQDPGYAQVFLDRLGEVAADDRTRELAARLALGLGYPSAAITIARTAGVAGQMLIRQGWPMPVDPPSSLDPAITYGIIRQESSFNADIASAAGAIGLMQLLPSTARRIAAKDDIPYDGDLTNPDTNMALGTAYFNKLMQSFGDCLPLAIAAYNAGPSNVAKWLVEYGDPEMGAGPGGANMIDWVEEIPYGETRNYVQRVTESIVVYRALETGRATSPLSRWLQS